MKSYESAQASARATVVVQIDQLSVWGAATQIKQLFEQASQDAINRIKRAISSDELMHIVGEPKVTLISSKICD